MNNIFKNVYFVKPYRTRDNRKAIILQKTFDYDDITQKGFIVATNDWQGTYTSYPIDMDGKTQCWNNQRPEDLLDGSDLVSEWIDETNEEKLKELARTNNPYSTEFNYYGFRLSWFEGFEVGYKLALEKKK